MPSAQQTHLLIIEDNKGRREILLDRPSYSIGRDPQCDMHLPSRFVLRHHATLVQVLDEDRYCSFSYRIVDSCSRRRQSANGLVINNHKVETHTLRHEDEIVFGPKIRAVYYRLEPDIIMTSPPDEFDILFANDDDDLAGGIAPVPRPWKPTPPPLTDGEATYPDKI